MLTRPVYATASGGGRALRARVGVRATMFAVAVALAVMGALATVASGRRAPGATAQSAASTSDPAPPPIRHVFVIVLENESASTTFAKGSPAPYLAKTLRSEGAFLPKYSATGHESNDNYVAMISGQPPNLDNQTDCQFYGDFPVEVTGEYGAQEGEGCIYPANIQTIAGQLDAAHQSWRDYNQDLGNTPSREARRCGHPAVNSQDGTQKATAEDQYATRHDPFVYFHSIIDQKALCDGHVVNLNGLPAALRQRSKTPNYVFITPNLCDDGHDSPCANGQPGGLRSINTFLQKWVPRITHSPAFRQQNGLLIVTFDEAATSDASSCCGEIAAPASVEPGIVGPGGGDVGAVLLSPCIRPGTVSQEPYNHYTMLRSVEDIFRLGHLGYAQLPGERTFGSDVFTRKCNGRPSVRIWAPRSVAATGRWARFHVRWHSRSPGASYTVQERAGRRGRWHPLRRHTSGHRLTFRGRAGRTYHFRVRATSGAGIRGRWRSRAVRVVHG